MNSPDTIRHNAKILLKAVRGKSKAERWNHYACLISGLLMPVIAVHRVWIGEKAAFTVDTSMTWAQARNR